MKCPSCSKFAGLEMQEPEVNDLSLDVESRSVTADVRIVRNSECCGDEMKSYDFNTETELPDAITEKMDAILKSNPEAEFEVEEASLDTLEEGGGRYAKSYFGFTLSASIKYGELPLGAVELTDKCAASEMDELN